jgi:SAM-dependent methyltransferase
MTDSTSRIARWASGIPDELAFWQSVLPQLKTGRPEDHYRLAPDAPVHPHLEQEIAGLARSEVRILDVGAGPLSGVGKKSGHARVMLTAVDPLAHGYDRILADLDIEPPVRTSFADGESLTEFFAEDSFDIVVMENSLDHSWDPLQVVAEMLRVARIGGLVLLDHFEREAEIESYQGFHQWNVENVGGRLHLWHGSERHCIDAIFAASCTVTTETLPAMAWGQPRNVVRARLRKIAPLSGFSATRLPAKYESLVAVLAEATQALHRREHELADARKRMAADSAGTPRDALRKLVRPMAAPLRRLARRLSNSPP